MLALVAVGFNLIFNTTKLFHLAHVALYVAGAYALLHLTAIMLTDIGIFALNGSLIVVTILAMPIEKLVYQQLSKKKAGQARTSENWRKLTAIYFYTYQVNS